MAKPIEPKEEKEIKERKTKNIEVEIEASVAEDKISLTKFFQLYSDTAHLYVQAYLIEKTRGILSTRSQWLDYLNHV